VEIIPVIDILGGIVVRAGGQVRLNYPPLTSSITQSVDPFDVISDLLKLDHFRIVYLADLDAILHKRNAVELYQKLCAAFPETIFWIDAGLATLEQCETIVSMGAVPVVGSETLLSYEWLRFIPQAVLSLDFKDGQLMGPALLLMQPEFWPPNVIAMNLDFVGRGNGVDTHLIQSLRGRREKFNLFAAGGVRDDDDLSELETLGVAGVLVASALHDKKITLKKKPSP
jgi:phosphoribosylformimino-5-aminoimidazole carboxamide ribotide isomerase